MTGREIDRELTDTERLQARRALITWMESQEINPGEATLVMIELIAMCLVDKTTDILELQESVNAIRAGLIMNIALEIKGKSRR